MSIPVLSYRAADNQRTRPPVTLLDGFVFLLLGVLLPLICFGISLRNYPAEPEWQMGGWHRYVVFIPDGRVGYPFFPLLTYSMISLVLFVLRPVRARNPVLRMGLYTGIILGLQYSVIQSAALNRPADPFEPEYLGILAMGLGSNLILFGGLKVVQLLPWRRLLGRTRNVATAIIAAVALVILMPFTLRVMSIQTRLPSPLDVGLSIVICAPAWCVGTYAMAAWAARRLCRDQGAPRPRFASWLATPLIWLAAYATAWKWSMINAVALYASLPTSAPGCYIASAAASGHRCFVGSRPVRASNGSVFPANAQLRRLKCVEIAIAAMWPEVHRMMRRIYDQEGPPLARLIARHPLLADATYAVVKPVEWIAFGALVALVPQIKATSQEIYPPARLPAFNDPQVTTRN